MDTNLKNKTRVDKIKILPIPDFIEISNGFVSGHVHTKTSSCESINSEIRCKLFCIYRLTIQATNFRRKIFWSEISEIQKSCIFRFTEIISFETGEEIDNKVWSARNKIVMHYLSTCW